MAARHRDRKKERNIKEGDRRIDRKVVKPEARKKG